MVFIQGSPIELLGQVGSGQEVTLERTNPVDEAQ